jgi:hypothetical protein
LVAITGRSSNLFRATISALTGRNPAQRFRSPDGEQNRKIFLTFFNRAPQKFFSIKETKIFLFCLPANAGIAETLPTPDGAGGQKFIPPDPLPFCPPAGNQKVFFRTAAGLQIRWRVGLKLF